MLVASAADVAFVTMLAGGGTDRSRRLKLATSVAAGIAMAAEASPVCSVRHEHRQTRIIQNPPGEAAENHLARPPMAIRAHHQQVDVRRTGGLE